MLVSVSHLITGIGDNDDYPRRNRYETFFFFQWDRIQVTRSFMINSRMKNMRAR